MPAIVVALICAGAAWYHLACIEPALWAHRARPIVFAAAAVASALAIGSLGLLPLLPGRAVLVVCLAWFVLVATPALALWLMREPRSVEGDRARAVQLTKLALDALAVRDVAQWREMMAAIGRIEDPEAERLANAARRYADEAAAGAPVRAETIARYRDEGQLYLAGRKKSHRTTNTLAVGLAALIGLIPAMVFASPTACEVAETLLASERRTLASANPRAEPTGPALLLPGAGYTPVGSGAMSMVEAAGTRYDPNTLNQLRDAGFLQAYWALWVHESGSKLGADLFVFAAQSGAVDYQEAVTRYACRYATEAFPIPGGGIGLQIRYGSGDPIREQAAWVVGPARAVIAVGHRDAPVDHHELLDLVEQLR